MPRWTVSAERTDASPIRGNLRSASAANRGASDRGGNMPCSQSAPASHCVPGAISNGPMSSVTSTEVMLKARDVSRCSSTVSRGAGKSRWNGWSNAPGSGTSKPTSMIW